MTSAKTISLKNAQRLALWLAHEQPQLFAVIHAKVTAMRASGQLSGLGCACVKRIGTFGQTGFTYSGSTGSFDAGSTSLPGVTSWDSSIGNTGLNPAGTTGITSWDNSIGVSSPGGTGPQLQQIGLTDASNAGSTALTTPLSVSGSSGFWGNFASDVGSLGSSVGPAIADVAGALTSGSTLAALAGVASAYYQANPSQAASLTQTQIARTAAGQSPAAIAGSTLYTATGNEIPVTSSLLSDLTPSEESMLIPILLIGALALVLLA